jgi:thiamine biosynthesis lipoprotein ApbE
MKNCKILTLAALLAALISLSGCVKSKEWRRSNGAVWNTLYNITYEADRDLSDSIQAVFRQVEQSLSPFNDNSLISQINRNESVATDSLLRYVFRMSSEVCRNSGGKFDPTVSPIVNLGSSAIPARLTRMPIGNRSRSASTRLCSMLGFLIAGFCPMAA